MGLPEELPLVLEIVPDADVVDVFGILGSFVQL